MWHCSNERHWDAAQLAIAITGQWRLIWIEGELGRHLAHSDRCIMFAPDGHFKTTVNGQAMDSGAWNVQTVDFNGLGIQMLDGKGAYSYSSIPSRVLLCNDKLLFDDAHRDSVNSYYNRGR